MKPHPAPLTPPKWDCESHRVPLRIAKYRSMRPTARPGNAVGEYNRGAANRRGGKIRGLKSASKANRGPVKV